MHGLLLHAVLRHGAAAKLGERLAELPTTAKAVRLSTASGKLVEGDADRRRRRAQPRASCCCAMARRAHRHLAYRTMLEQAVLPHGLRSDQVTAWLGPRLHWCSARVRGGQWMNVVAIVQGQPAAELDDWDQRQRGRLARHGRAPARRCAS